MAERLSLEILQYIRETCDSDRSAANKQIGQLFGHIAAQDERVQALETALGNAVEQVSRSTNSPWISSKQGAEAIALLAQGDAREAAQ